MQNVGDWEAGGDEEEADAGQDQVQDHQGQETSEISQEWGTPSENIAVKIYILVELRRWKIYFI